MMIADAIAEATTEHEVYFLLTAYLESVRYGDQHGLLPDDLTRLPLAGPVDVENRLQHLWQDHACLPQASHRTYTLMREACNVMGRAYERLIHLGPPPQHVPG